METRKRKAVEKPEQEMILNVLRPSVRSLGNELYAPIFSIFNKLFASYCESNAFASVMAEHSRKFIWILPVGAIDIPRCGRYNITEMIREWDVMFAQYALKYHHLATKLGMKFPSTGASLNINEAWARMHLPRDILPACQSNKWPLTIASNYAEIKGGFMWIRFVTVCELSDPIDDRRRRADASRTSTPMSALGLEHIYDSDSSSEEDEPSEKVRRKNDTDDDD